MENAFQKLCQSLTEWRRRGAAVARIDRDDIGRYCNGLLESSRASSGAAALRGMLRRFTTVDCAAAARAMQVPRLGCARTGHTSFEHSARLRHIPMHQNTPLDHHHATIHTTIQTAARLTAHTTCELSPSARRTNCGRLHPGPHNSSQHTTDTAHRFDVGTAPASGSA